MKILNCTATNFASYGYVHFNYEDTGLLLVQGATGAGKSTLFDLPCWVLYGITAKGGSVDEVRNWKADAATSGTVQVQTHNHDIEVTRIRGKQVENDLYWIENGIIYRGKDLKDTQAKLEVRLGVSAELYIAGCYFNEFSLINSFFTASAKTRRGVLDLIADTSLADTLNILTSARKKTTKQQQTDTDKQISLLERDVLNLKAALIRDTENDLKWAINQNRKIEKTQHQYENFEINRQQDISHIQNGLEQWVSNNKREKQELKASLLIALDNVCPTCGNNEGNLNQIKQNIINKNQELNPYNRQLEKVKNVTNTYKDLLQQLETELNPFKDLVKDYKLNLSKTLAELENERHIKGNQAYNLDLLENLLDVAVSLRGELVRQSINSIQNQANEYLEKFFDSEIRISLVIEDTDSIEVEIKKNGYDCVYSQLSKGQRGLLKLCFSLSVMAAASNKAGCHFDNIFLDEALDGLDPELKVRSYGLLSELNLKHASVLVIDHSEDFKTLFENKVEVSLVNDESRLS